jgi:hypothetical protein
MLSHLFHILFHVFHMCFTSLFNLSLTFSLSHLSHLLLGPFPVKSEFPSRPFASAHHGFVAANPGDLALAEGDVVGVLAQGQDGWWYGESQGETLIDGGWVLFVLDCIDGQ